MKSLFAAIVLLVAPSEDGQQPRIAVADSGEPRSRAIETGCAKLIPRVVAEVAPADNVRDSVARTKAAILATP